MMQALVCLLSINQWTKPEAQSETQHQPKLCKLQLHESRDLNFGGSIELHWLLHHKKIWKQHFYCLMTYQSPVKRNYKNDYCFFLLGKKKKKNKADSMSLFSGPCNSLKQHKCPLTYTKERAHGYTMTIHGFFQEVFELLDLYFRSLFDNQWSLENRITNFS